MISEAHLDVAGLVGDQAAVSADVSLLARPQAHAPPAHRALGAPGVTSHVTCTSLHLAFGFTYSLMCWATKVWSM